MKIGSRLIDFSQGTMFMGILNVTPDSFSDGGLYANLDAALAQTQTLVEEGADIIDVGGESTRPGHQPVSGQEELERVAPVIEAIRQRFDIPISVDTYKAQVAEAGVLAGADMINDVWGFKADPEIARVAAKHGVPCCLSHNKQNKNYPNLVQDVIDDLRESVEIATGAGVSTDKIIVDPGLGFAKEYEHNLILMNNLEKLHVLGYPILLGASRKSFIGLATGNTNAAERDVATVATTVIGIMKGCQIIRVHNVAMNKEAAKLADTVLKQEDRQ
ncbi:MAG: dihydropteroate synthase [Oscillospiraceae bacterium]|nr:dihydropteroate synthase [Oscillospiraceae bacterium]